MKFVRGYSEFFSSLNDGIRAGVIADANVLISASYELDPANAKAVQFFDLLAENDVPVLCNVIAKLEFLEIHRRIIFTEALLDAESEVDKSAIPEDLVNKFNSIRSRAGKRTKQGQVPLRLSEGEIKEFKSRMSQIQVSNRDNWTVLCEDRVSDKLSSVWNEAELGLGLNLLSSRNADHSGYFVKEPSWSDAIRLMESHGLSSSDAMILNMFLCSNFAAIVTSDWEVAASVRKVGDPSKMAFCPDEIAARLA